MAITCKTEWLVRQVDRVGKTDLENAKLTKTGDVIVVKESPATWSTKELESDAWIIIKTDMDLVDAEFYLKREPGFYEEKPLLKARDKHLSLPTLMKAIREEARFLDERHKEIPNRNTPFILSKEVMSEFTAIKPRTRGKFE